MKPELQRRVQRYGWDKAAEYYENCWQAQLKPAHDLLVETANIRTDENVLDIAAGTGLITFRIAEKVGKSGRVLATDISDEMVNIGTQRALSRAISNISFERMDAENLKCEDNTFDLATCALGLMYFPDPDASLREMHRVLKSGGSGRSCGLGVEEKMRVV